MVTQVRLTEDEAYRLDELAMRLGRTSEDLVREAVADLLSRSEREDRLTRMRAARGLWADRDDLPDLRELRAEWDRDRESASHA